MKFGKIPKLFPDLKKKRLSGGCIVFSTNMVYKNKTKNNNKNKYIFA